MVANKKFQPIFTYLIQSIIICILFFIGSRISLYATMIPGQGSAFYLPAGLAVSLVIFLGIRILPIVFLAKFLLTYSNTGIWSLSFFSALATMTEGFLAWYIFVSFKESIEEFFQYQSNLVLVTFFALVASVGSAVIGVSNLYYHNLITEQNYFSNFLNWFAGDFLSIVIFTPLVVCYRAEKQRILDFIFPFLAVVFVLIFKYDFMAPYLFLIFFILLIPCCLSTPMGIYYSSALISLLLNWFLINQIGPFSKGSYYENMASMQIFLLSLAITSLALDGFRRTNLTKYIILPLMTLWLASGSIYYFYYNQKLTNDNMLFYKLTSDFESRVQDKMAFLENSVLGASGFVVGSDLVTSEEWNDYVNTLSRTINESGVKGFGVKFLKSDNLLFTSDSINEDEFKKYLNDSRFKSAFDLALLKKNAVLSGHANFNGEKISLLLKSIRKDSLVIGWIILPLNIDSFFNSLTTNRNTNIEIDVYENFNLSSENLVFSRVIDPKMLKSIIPDNLRITIFKLVDRNFRIDWKNTMRFTSKYTTQNSLFLLMGALFSLTVTGFFLRLKLSNVNSNVRATKLQQEVEDSAERYKLIFEESIDSILIFDEKKVIDCNKESLKLFKKKAKKDVISSPLLSLMNIYPLKSEIVIEKDKNIYFQQKLSELENSNSILFECFLYRSSIPYPVEIRIDRLLNDNRIFYKAQIKNLVDFKKNEAPLIQNDYIQKTIELDHIKSEAITPTDTKPKTQNPNTPFKGQNVLLVEDNQVNIIVTKKFLEKWGLCVDVAFNGLEAVEKSKSNDYSLILMDLHMPVMDGIEATKKIRVFNNTTPVIGLSADVLSQGLDQYLSYGMNEFITKPFNPQNFLLLLLKFIKQPQESTT